MPFPTCPHCGKELPTVSIFSWQMGPLSLVCAYCPELECRAVLSFQFVPVGLAEESRIALPS